MHALAVNSVSTLLNYLTVCFSFIRLADYLIVNTMHVLAVNSVSTLLNYLTEQLQNTPTLAQIQGEEEEPEEEEKEKDKDIADKVGHKPVSLAINSYRHGYRIFRTIRCYFFFFSNGYLSV